MVGTLSRQLRPSASSAEWVNYTPFSLFANGTAFAVGWGYTFAGKAFLSGKTHHG